MHANTLDPKDPSNYITPRTQIEFRTTDGCLNAGTQMVPLLDKLMALGVFAQEDVIKPRDGTTQTLGWKVSKQLGKAFLIVKDADE